MTTLNTDIFRCQSTMTAAAAVVATALSSAAAPPWLRLASVSRTLGILVMLALHVSATTAVASAAASTIGFDPVFTNAAAPFAVSECDAACASPGFVTLALTLTRTGDISVSGTVTVSTRMPTVTAGLAAATPLIDYTPLSGVSVTFASNEKTKVVSVTVVSDGVYEEDERFEVVLENPSAGVTLATSSTVAYISIQDGGDAGIFAFSASSYTLAENSGLVSVKLIRTGGSSGVVTVLCRLANPTQATAANNKNFRLLDSNLQVQFSDGQREALVSFRIIDDAVYEANEFFYLEIASMLPTKASEPQTSVAKIGAPRSAVIFIADDGDAGVFNFAAPFMFCREDNGTAILTVVRTKGSSSSSYMPVNLVITTLGTQDGSNATEGGSLAFDYLAKSDKLNWADGETKKAFTIKIFNNNRYQAQTRAVKVKMTTVEGGASIGPQSEAWVYIIDDRDAGTISFGKPEYEVLESGGSVTIDILRTGIADPTAINTYSSGAVQVEVLTFAGTILPGKSRYDLASDYGVVQARGCTHISPCTAPEGLAYTPLRATTISFADGETSKAVTIAILNDDLFQAPDRVFKVVLQKVSGGAHIGVDYEHPSEWFGYRDAFLALEKQNAALLDNVGAIVTIKDDGDPAILVSRASLSVSEIGQSDSFQVRLNSQPSADVTVTFGFDAAVLALSLPKLVFTSANWRENQAIKVRTIPDSKGSGLHRTDITLSSSSADAKYVSPWRTVSNSAGAVLGMGVYTQLRGEYDTGNAEHEFLWSERDGVMTAPRATYRLAVYILDNKHAAVVAQVESIRHASGVNVPTSVVVVRRDGHSAVVRISLATEPEADVTLTLTPESRSGVSVDPPSFVIGAAKWKNSVEVRLAAIEVVGQAETDTVRFSAVSVVMSSAGDAQYNQGGRPAGRIFVQRLPAARVLMDSTVAMLREGAGESESAVYSLRLGSEPMHWEPQGTAYSPFEVFLDADADTTLVFPPPANADFGKASTFTAAGNSSQSTKSKRVKSLGALRFQVYPDVSRISGSNQVGSARLRLYRVSGGENGGLGGIRVGVSVAGVDASFSGWDESGLQSRCSDTLENNGVCTVLNGATVLPSFFASGVTVHNIDRNSDGEVAVMPAGPFDGATNLYVASPAWLEIDVTYAVNRFLASAEGAVSPKAITFLVYSRSSAGFTYDGVDEVVFASKEHASIDLRPQLRMTASGSINLALKASVAQSCPGNAKAAIDGSTSSKLSLSSTFALSATPLSYPWWEADLSTQRIIEDIIVTVKKKLSSTSSEPLQLQTSFWVFLSDASLAANNNGATGFESAKSKARFAKRFDVTTRSFDASEDETITFRWHVNGEKRGGFATDRFVGDFTAPVEIRYLLLQVEGDNNVALNEVEIYQVALASARVSIGGFMPSMAQSRLGRNQLVPSLPSSREDASSECDAATDLCRRELTFTSGNWRSPQLVRVNVIDDQVVMGDRDIFMTHTLESNDPDYDEAARCLPLPAGVSAGSIACKNAVFNDSSVKAIRILEDDENKILLSTHTLELVEGSRSFPTAPVFVRPAVLSPFIYRCSGTTEMISTARECGLSFGSDPSATWETCIANSSAAPLEPWSAWMMAGFPPGTMNISRIDIIVPPMQGAKYIKRFSLWWSSSVAVGSTDTGVTSVSSGWEELKTIDVSMKSSGPQTFTIQNLHLFPVQALLVALERSYDDAKRCLVAPQVRITGFAPVLFPLPVRGDLESRDSVPPSLSRLSRMHLPGKSGVVRMQLASEPITDVVVSAVLEAKNLPLIVFDATNKTNAPEFVRSVAGASYESGQVWSFTMATAIKFTAANWNTPQELTFAAVDDNIFNGDRSFTVSHTAITCDSQLSDVPYQRVDGQVLTKGLTILPVSLSYTTATFIMSVQRANEWPRRFVPTWSSGAGTIDVAVVDDDLPGVSVSASVIRVSESGPTSNFSVFLDSAPFRDVTVAVSYELDATLLSVTPLELVFTVTNWMEPQYVFVHPTPNDVYDGEQPFTLAYDRLIPKAKKPSLALAVKSSDPAYDGIRVGGNEGDRSKPYVVDQSVRVVLLDDDTGCLGEYACQNAGTCMSSSSGNVCACPDTFGMRDCSASCKSKRECEFSRVLFRLKCLPEAANAVCGTTLSPSDLTSTLYRMLTSSEFTSASGKVFAKLSLSPVPELLYTVNSSRVDCLGGSSSGACVNVWIDIKSPSDSVVLQKLEAFVASGSLKAKPVFAELTSSEPQYPQAIGATIAVWVFIGFCGLCVIAVGGLFSARMVRAKVSHVTPQLDPDPVATSPASEKPPSSPMTSPRAT
ncbi:hypothetical protein PybrP1_012688 [[Pythium] brassicae (nom. inval.)]|nr:hypothetical protein PybrP1_012688 [[Pythium] brassicae (nom. inval.)]